MNNIFNNSCTLDNTLLIFNPERGKSIKNNTPNQALHLTRQPAARSRRLPPFPRGAGVEMPYN
jgi:hypothetical protein